VGIEATRASWRDAFEYARAVSLLDVESLHFWHRAAWDRWGLAFRLFMQPTPLASGVYRARLEGRASPPASPVEAALDHLLDPLGARLHPDRAPHIRLLAVEETGCSGNRANAHVERIAILSGSRNGMRVYKEGEEAQEAR